MEDRNGGAIIAIGGVLTVVVFGIWALRFLRALFNELAKTFDAFGGLAASSLVMLGNVLLAAVLIAAIVGSVVAAVYFTYKYIMLVKRGTEIQEWVDRRLHQAVCELDGSLRGFRSEVTGRVGRMEVQLAEALKEPDHLPLLSAAVSEPTDVTSGQDSTYGVQATNEPVPDDDPPVSQPY